MTPPLANRLTRHLGARLMQQLRGFALDQASPSATATAVSVTGAVAAAAEPLSQVATSRLTGVNVGMARRPASARTAAARPLVSCGTAAMPMLPSSHTPLPAAPSQARRPQTRPQSRSTPAGARCTVDPADERRTVISGSMSEVCDALDRLIARQALQIRSPGVAAGVN